MSRPLDRRSLLQKSAAGATAATIAAPMLNLNASAKRQDGGTLRVYWHPGHAYETYEEVIATFEEDNPGWTVNFELYQWPDLRTKVLADFAAGNPPDLLEEPGGWAQEFALAGYLQPLDDYIAADGEAMGFPDDWQPGTLERHVVDGSTYGIQLHLTCTLLFYNRAMLADAGFDEAPTNWEEFLEVAQATANGNVFGFAPNQSVGYAWSWLLQNEVSYYDPETNTVPMDTADAHAALQFQTDLIHEHNVAPVPIASADYEGPQRLFSANRAAMILTGPWDILPILEGSPDLDWGIAQALTKKVQATPAAGTSMLIPRGAAAPDLAWDLMKRFTQLDVELAATAEANMAMPRISWAEHPDVQANEPIAPFGEGLSYAEDVGAQLRLTGEAGAIEELFRTAYERAIYRGDPAEHVLGDFVEESNAILAG